MSGLAFRGGTHELCSASFDRSVKVWSLDDRTPMDTLLGHQAEVLAIDMLRQVSWPRRPPLRPSPRRMHVWSCQYTRDAVTGKESRVGNLRRRTWQEMLRDILMSVSRKGRS